jgi:hypothetical protein
MRATFAIVLLSVIGQLGLAQQDDEDVLPFSYGDYEGYGGSVSGKGADSQTSRGK